MSDLHFKSSDELRIVEITPAVSRELLFSLRRCYMGISLDNPVFQNGSLEAIVNWSMENFDHTLIVVGDYLRRFNETILNGLRGQSAAIAAIKVGDQFLTDTQNYFNSLDTEKITVTRWKPCLENEQYMTARKIIDRLYTQNEEFRAAIQRDAFSFVQRQQKRNQEIKVSTEEAIELSCHYLLEETAVFNTLSEQGWQVEVYPGPELEVLNMVAKGQFPQIPNGLKKRINVEIGPRKKKD